MTFGKLKVDFYPKEKEDAIASAVAAQTDVPKEDVRTGLLGTRVVASHIGEEDAKSLQAKLEALGCSVQFIETPAATGYA